MVSKASAEYMTDVIMPSNRKAGCTCPYSQEMYEKGDFSHMKDCPSPMIECLPNAAGLMEALRHL
jgi:hypothetical protein